MTEYHIGEAAEGLKVSTRTLRHWDAIGLLSPGWRTMSDYRLYTDADLERGARIQIYRAAGVPLKEIAELLTAPEAEREVLHRQRTRMVKELGHLHRMIRAVDELLERGETMTINDKIELFGEDWPDYQAEAEDKWGDTPEWAQSMRRQKKMTMGDWQAVKDEQDQLVEMLIDAHTRAVQPGSEEAAAIVEKHRESIARWYDVPRARQVVLARMYVQDGRFAQMYRGQAGYLLELIEAQARAEGIDPDAAEWCVE